MFKKSLAIVLVAAMTLGLTGCFQAGSNGGPDTLAPVNTSAEAGSQKEETSRHEETTEAVSSETASSEATEKGSEIAPSVDKGTEESKQDKMRQVLIDNDTCRLEWVSFRIEENGNNVFKFRFENKTADTKLHWGYRASSTANINEDNVLVNGYQIHSWSSFNGANGHVDPGKSDDRIIIIGAKDLKALDMKTVDRLDLPISVISDSGTNIVNEKYTLYPTGLDEASFIFPERLSAEGDRVIVDNGSYKYVVIGADEKSWFTMHDVPCYSIYVYVQNDTDKLMYFSDGDYSINGKEMDGDAVFTFDVIYVAPKSKNLFSISIENNVLDYMGITEMKEFEYSLYGHVYRGGGTWDHPVEEKITIDLTKLRKID